MKLIPLLLTAVFATHASAAGDNNMPTLSNADLEMGLTAIKAKDWKRAVSSMQAATNYDPNSADAWNWLGYSYRNAGDYKNALTAYDRALKIDPKHRGAHEYLGEAYVLTGDREKAQQHLAALEKICGTGCDEYKDLAKAIAAAKQ
jgi:Tfp pilus assembly protein PilF